MQPIETSTQAVQEEQRICSMLLLKLLYQLYQVSRKIRLEIEVDDSNNVTAYFTPQPQNANSETGEGCGEKEPLTKKRGRKRASEKEAEEYSQEDMPEQVLLYEIFREPYYNKVHYWIRVQNGKRQKIEFGRYQKTEGINCTFFSNAEYNYLEALYNLRRSPEYTPKKERQNMSPRTIKALQDLDKQNTHIKLQNVTSWDETHIEVIKYLQEIVKPFRTSCR